MEQGFTQKIEELALLVMMLHEGDEQGFTFVFDTCRGAVEEFATPEFERFHSAVRYLESQKALPPAELLKLVREFVAAAQAYVLIPATAVFPGEQAVAATGDPVWGNDLDCSAELSLIVDFIENHTSRLDEFEGAVMTHLRRQAQPGTPGSQLETTTFVKGYLHNLKGDAGTVGLAGVAKVTHALESLLDAQGLDAVAERLIEYKEWVLETLKAYSEKRAPARFADVFLETLEHPQAEACAAAPAPAAAVMKKYTLTGDPEILTEFVLEAEDHLSSVEEILLGRETGYDEEAVNAIFRAIHSIKGGSAYFNLEEVTKTSHIAENLLDRVRKGQISLTAELKALLLTYIDLQKSLFTAARSAMAGSGEMMTSERATTYLAQLEAYGARVGNGAEAATTPTMAAVEPVLATVPAPGQTAPAIPPSDPVAETGARKDRTEEKLDLKTFVKVDTERLDRLIEYIGEMVISSSMLIKSCRDLLPENESVVSNTHELEKIARDIQEIGMSMRLVPLKGLFQKMSRLVWDTAKKIGKEINFKMEGEDTELDRTIIERIADPLMHMVRNALDHGIELPADRMAQKKSAAGHISLSAFHHGGSIHIRITDDGRGLNPEKLLAKAVEKGLVPAGHRLGLQETYQLIFAPGFSTAEKVTDISGRGVGMDVVRRNIEALRGRIHIESEVGKGSIFTIELPLTVAMIDGIEVMVGPEHFIVPTLSVVEFVKPKPGMISTPFDSGETLLFRENHLPIFRLSEIYGISSAVRDLSKAIIMVVESNGKHAAIVFDDVVGTYSTVIKNLGPTFEGIKGLAGCAIMPNGSIGLILDVATLVELALSPQARCSYNLETAHAIEASGASVH